MKEVSNNTNILQRGFLNSLFRVERGDRVTSRRHLNIVY